MKNETGSSNSVFLFRRKTVGTKVHALSVWSKQMICFLLIIRNWIIQCIHVLRFAHTFPSYMPFFATFSALILKEKCSTLFFWMTQCLSTEVTLRLPSRQLFAIALALRASAVLLWLECFFSPVDLLLISMDLPHKPTSVSEGFIILCYFDYNTELHNVTILVTMTISIQLSL